MRARTASGVVAAFLLLLLAAVGGARALGFLGLFVVLPLWIFAFDTMFKAGEESGRAACDADSQDSRRSEM